MQTLLSVKDMDEFGDIIRASRQLTRTPHAYLFFVARARYRYTCVVVTDAELSALVASPQYFRFAVEDPYEAPSAPVDAKKQRDASYQEKLESAGPIP